MKPFLITFIAPCMSIPANVVMTHPRGIGVQDLDPIRAQLAKLLVSKGADPADVGKVIFLNIIPLPVGEVSPHEHVDPLKVRFGE